MILASMQPSLWPWLGLFDAMRRADLFILSSDVALGGPSWRHRNRLRNVKGPVWLTIPLVQGQEKTPIREVLISGTDWIQAHEGKIRGLYGRARFWREALEIFERALEDASTRGGGTERLAPVAVASMVQTARALGISTPVVTTAGLLDDFRAVPGDPSARLLRLCQRARASGYLAAAAQRAYLDVARFRAAGVEVEFQDYKPAPYPQIHGGPFVSHLSILDVVANVGLAGARKLLEG